VSGSSLAPAFLIAMPQLRDPNFERTVVLLVHHDENGTIGVVLNRQTDMDAPQLCADLEIEWCGGADETVDWGGPVRPNTGWVLFDGGTAVAGSDDVTPVGQGIYFAGSLEVLRRLADDPPAHVRLLLGYAGWGPGQLEAELTEGAWLVAPLARDVVFGANREGMWERVLRDLGVEPATLIPTRGVH
jgi:putative transcriptional regulator